MILITGDTHADFSRFSSKRFHAGKELTKEDHIIICGDFGGVWDRSERQRAALDWLEEKPWTTLWVDGNHENYDLLGTYQVDHWRGGKVQYIRGNVIHLMRGQVYDINGKRIFTMGGARSHDISDGILDLFDVDLAKKIKRLDDACKFMYRINHLSWWEQEMPSKEEYNEARRNLERVGWKVDTIITHCAPDSAQAILGHGMYEPDELTHFLQEVYERCNFKHWYFGHYHDDRDLNEMMHLRYESICEMKG